jgi:hypothetical protein
MDPLITVVRRLVVHSHRTGIHTVSQLMKDTHREEAHPLLLVGIEAPPNVGVGTRYAVARMPGGKTGILSGHISARRRALPMCDVAA